MGVRSIGNCQLDLVHSCEYHSIKPAPWSLSAECTLLHNHERRPCLSLSFSVHLTTSESQDPLFPPPVCFFWPLSHSALCYCPIPNVHVFLIPSGSPHFTSLFPNCPFTLYPQSSFYNRSFTIYFPYGKPASSKPTPY